MAGAPWIDAISSTLLPEAPFYVPRDWSKRTMSGDHDLLLSWEGRSEGDVIWGLLEEIVERLRQRTDTDENTLNDLHRFTQEVIDKQGPFQSVKIPSYNILTLLRGEMDKQIKDGRVFGMEPLLIRLNSIAPSQNNKDI